LLSKEIATSMRGRTLTYVIFPFSFKEYLKAKKIKVERTFSTYEKAKLMQMLRDYVEFGGFPEAVLYKKERKKILAELKETAIYKDVIERHKVRNVKALRLLINAIISSREFSVHKFYNYLKSLGIKVSKNSLYNYIQYLEDAFFITIVRKFSYSYKETEQSIPKIYPIDNGILKISGIEDKGKLMENLICTELLRRGKEISYYKDSTIEVDFVLKEGKKITMLIQACYDISNFNTREREIGSLFKASKKLNCKNLLIISWDLEEEVTYKGKKIRIVPLWKWLLELT
jgi:hypothetical protein